MERIQYYSESDNVFYHRQDFLNLDWHNLVDIEDTLVFFDDHQDIVPRVLFCREKGFKKIITEDNYCTGRGDCRSLKQVFDRNDETTRLIRDIIKTYYEMPPIMKTEKTRWGDDWNDENYPTPEPLLDKLEGERKLFEKDLTGYTWISFVEVE